ncbi:CAAD domain-containing protein [Trichodesmium erythraeum 21-75]|nr:CAAD domain-containing protein [Trichodesmium erythraeum 21-75]
MYSGWFTYRYLIRASNRQELSAEIKAWKEQILGNRPSDS